MDKKTRSVVIQVGLAVVAGAGSTVVALSSAKVIEIGLCWKLAAVSVVGFIGFYTPTYKALEDHRYGKRMTRKRRAELPLRSLVLYVHERTGISIRGLEVLFYSYRKKSRVRGEKIGLEARFSMTEANPVRFRWRTGVGVAGKCLQHSVYGYFHADAQPLKSRQEWDQGVDKDLYGLLYEDYSEIWHRYGFISATPVHPLTDQIDRNRPPLGCVILTAPRGESNKILPVQNDVKRRMEEAAHAVRGGFFDLRD